MDMKICFISEYFPKSEKLEVRGGAEASAYKEAFHLAKNHEITVLTSLEEDMHPQYEINNIKVKGCGSKRSYVQSGSFQKRLSFMYHAYQEGCKLDLDLVVGYNWITHWVAWKIGRKLNIPVAVRYHDVWIGEWIKNVGLAGFTGEILERYNLSRDIDLIVAVSAYTKNKLAKFFPEEKIVVVPNIVDFPPVKSEKYSHTTISCVSRLVEYKRVEDLIKALFFLKQENMKLQCKIIGTGPQENLLREMVDKYELQSQVEFCGFMEKHADVLKVINSSHLLCLPSKVEGFGLVIVEAMGCGVPFIASNIDPLREASGKKGGMFFKVQDPWDLAEKIKMILDNPDIYDKLKNEGKTQYLKYQGEKLAGELENYYSKLI